MRGRVLIAVDTSTASTADNVSCFHYLDIDTIYPMLLVYHSSRGGKLDRHSVVDLSCLSLHGP